MEIRRAFVHYARKPTHLVQEFNTGTVGQFLICGSSFLFFMANSKLSPECFWWTPPYNLTDVHLLYTAVDLLMNQ